jgi:uncharacterized protein
MRAGSRIAVLAPLVLLTCCSSGTIGRGDPVVRGVTAVFTTAAGRVRTGVLPVASSEAQREHGLMGRRTLPPDGGMIFAFPEPTEAGFWMRDTAIPLSVAFWNDDGRVVAILDMDPCRADPCPVYRPGVSYRTALEMRRGWFDRHGVAIGDHVELTPAAP